MKFSFMSFSTPELSLEAMIEVARQYGYDGLEPRSDARHAHGIEVGSTAAQREAARRAARESGIALACLATSLQFANAEKAEATVREAHERIDLAGDVGIPCLRVFGGSYPQETVSREQATATAVAGFRAVAPHAQDRGVTLCFETHDAWCDPKHVAAVLAEVNHPSIAANWDIMHPVRNGLATMDEAFACLKPWIRHLHVHDGVFPLVEGTPQLRMVPIGQGAVDHQRALKLLAAAGYEGYVSGEWINWEPYDVHLPRELAVMKRYLATGE